MGVRELPTDDEGVVGLDPGVTGRDPGVVGLAAIFEDLLDPGVIGAGRFPPAIDDDEVGVPIREGVKARGILPRPGAGDETFPAVLVFKGTPGDLGAIKDAPGERPTTPDLALETPPGERAIMAPRDAAAAGDRARLREDEAL